MTDRTERLEERVAHLISQVDDLSDTVAHQARAIDALERRVALLMAREAEREADGGGSAIFGDEPPPPHY